MLQIDTEGKIYCRDQLLTNENILNNANRFDFLKDILERRMEYAGHSLPNRLEWLDT